MHILSDEECQILVEIIFEQYGAFLKREDFSELLLGLFEDISGLECMSCEKEEDLVNQLWSRYFDKENHG